MPTIHTPPRLLMLGPLALLLSCSARPKSEEPPPGQRGAATPMTQKSTSPAPRSDGGPWLVLRGAGEPGSSRFLPVKLSGKAPEALAPLTLPGTSFEDRYGRKRFTAATHEGPTLAVARVETQAGGSAWSIEVRGLEEPAAAVEIAAGEVELTALYLRGDELYAGQMERLGAASLSAAPPSLKEFHRRELGFGKAYDLLFVEGDKLVAVDDQVSPYYADAFSLRKGGPPSHEAGWRLPGMINGLFTMGALRGGILYLVAPFGIMDGHGQTLAALPLSRLAELEKQNLVLNSGGEIPGLGVLEEFVSRRTGKPERLLAGAELTEWRGLGVAGGRLLLGAGKRGVLALPLDFGWKTRAEVVDPGGPCLDLIARGEDVYALVGEAASPSRSLVLLRLNEQSGAFEVVGKTPIEGAWDAFVR